MIQNRRNKSDREISTMMFKSRKRNLRLKIMRWISRFGKLRGSLLMVLGIYFLFSLRSQTDEYLSGIVSGSSKSILIDPPGPLFHLELGIGSSNIMKQNSNRVLIIAAAPRSIKHIVSLWSSLECFTGEVDYVAISAPDWSHLIIERFLAKAYESIPRFQSGKASLEAMVGINDRYDVGLWCDALSQMGITGDKSLNIPYDEIALLNDSIYALREYSEIFSALRDKNASMTSLNYSFIHPKGTGDQYYWLESVWRGFDQTGIRTFAKYSCKPPNDPMFCPRAWWGRKGCIVENFERAMAWQFPRDKTVGLFASDVPKDMITWKDKFPSWVRHAPYWNNLVHEQNFPVSKVNWEDMVDSIDDDRLKTCTQHLDHSWLKEFDFSAAKSAI